MVLAVDVGNSNIVLGGYHNDGEIRFVARIATDRQMEADQYAVQLRGVLELYGVGAESIDGIVMSNVVPQLTGTLLRALEHFSHVRPHLLGLADAGDVVVDIHNPAELGMDILASAIAVKRSRRALPAVIIDMGTATKLCALDADGKLLGVAISPGLFVSMEALVGRASLLSGIALEAPAAAIGKNTPESMKSGMILGTAAMLDGMIDRFAEEMGGLATVVATGGAASVVTPYCRHAIEISDTLLLDGLYKVYASLCIGDA